MEINSYLLRSTIQLLNRTASGVLDAAATSVDIAASLTAIQITPNLTFTLPSPTITVSGREFTVFNGGSVDFVIQGVNLPVGQFANFQWNDSAWRTLATGVSADFWRSGVGGTALPDGIGDVNQNIRRDGLVGIFTDPVSVLDASGSLGLGIFAESLNPVINVNSLMHTIRASSPVAQTISLQPAAFVPRRIHTLINPGNAVKTIANGPVINFDGTGLTAVPPSSSLTIQSDGTNWYVVDAGSLPQSATTISAFVALDAPVQLDNLRIYPRLAGGQGFRVSTVTGTMLANISAVTSFAADSVFAGNRAGLTLTTAPVHPFIWTGQTDADGMTGMVFDRTNNRFYEFTVMTNVAPTLSFVKITRVA